MIHGIRPQLAEAGKIKIGKRGDAVKTAKSGKKWRPPVKHDYFTITKTSRVGGDPDADFEPDEDLMQALADAGYADPDGKIRTIPIVLHSDDIDEVFPTAYVLYRGRNAACRGDGQTARRIAAPEVQIPCPCREYTDGRCKPHGILHCSIALPGMAVAGAVHKWRTTSIISITQMIGSLTHVIATVGSLRGVPLVLRVTPKHVEPEDAPASTVYVCHVELRASDLADVQQQALAAAQARAALRGQDDIRAQYRAMLTAPGDEPLEEQAEVQAEFYPDPEVIATDDVPADADAQPAPKDPLAEIVDFCSAMGATEEQTKAVARRLARAAEIPKNPAKWTTDDMDAIARAVEADLAQQQEEDTKSRTLRSGTSSAAELSAHPRWPLSWDSPHGRHRSRSGRPRSAVSAWSRPRPWSGAYG